MRDSWARLAPGERRTHLGLTPPEVSQHLAVLRRAGLVTAHRTGRWVLYRRTSLGTQLLSAAG